MHEKNRRRIAIRKKQYQELSVLEIQTYLTSIYHFYKWLLVEVLELQEREIASYSFKKQLSDIVNFIRNIESDHSMELTDSNKGMSVQDL